MGQFKHRQQHRLAHALIESLGTMLDSDALPDVLVPVPLHPNRRKQRGFNQAEVIALRLSRLSEVPAKLCWVERVRDTSHQRGLAAAEREANVAGAFTASSECAGLHVGVVDDVITTGATTAAVATACIEAGAAQVTAMALARTPRPPIDSLW